MSKLRVYRWNWLDKFMKRFFKKRYLKTWLYYHPDSFRQEFDEDGNHLVIIDLSVAFDDGDIPTKDELDSMVDIYYKIKKI